MKKLLRNIIALVIIALIITGSINHIYVKLYQSNLDYTAKFSNIPDRIQICNFGSSHGLFGYNYDDYSSKYECFNFGLVSQSLSYDYRLFQNYESHIENGAIVFITVSYFSLFGLDEIYDDEFDSKNKRYYRILPANLIKEYNVKTALLVKYFPVLGVDTKTLIKTLLGENQIDNTDIGWQQVSSNINVLEDAINAYDRHIINNKYDESGNRIINHEEINALYNLINSCKDKGAIPILITTPYLHEYTDAVGENGTFLNQYYSIINQIVSDTNVEYHDYAFDKRFSNRYDLFMNADHLNKDGAKIFTNIILAETINQ